MSVPRHPWFYSGLPYNMQAEQSVLGAVLLKPETLTDLVEIIRPEMFYTRQNAQKRPRGRKG